MADRNENDVRLEERTRALERAQGWHFIMEAVFVLAFILLSLLFVSGCRIPTPSLKTETDTREWTKSTKEEVEGLDVSIEEDPTRVRLVYDEKDKGSLRTHLDKIYIVIGRNNYSFTADFSESEVNVYKSYGGETSLYCTFKYQ